MSPTTDQLERFVAVHKLFYSDNPILNMCAAVAVIQFDPAENRKLHKAKSYSKIDGLVVLAMAMSFMCVEKTLAISSWDDPYLRWQFS